MALDFDHVNGNVTHPYLRMVASRVMIVEDWKLLIASSQVAKVCETENVYDPPLKTKVLKIILVWYYMLVTLSFY